VRLGRRREPLTAGGGRALGRGGGRLAAGGVPGLGAAARAVVVRGEDVDYLERAVAEQAEHGRGREGGQGEPEAAGAPPHPGIAVTRDPVLAATHTGRRQHAHGRSVVRQTAAAY